MGAFVKHTFKKGFILDEERIRKINELLTSRGNQVNSNCTPVYKVYREDTFSYTTNDIQDILNEDNSGWQSILRITISMKYANEFELELDFNHNENTTLHIEGNDRDIVFLIFSELRQYLSNEVNVIKLNLEDISSTVILGSFVVIILVYMMGWIWNMDRTIKPPKTSVPYEIALESSDSQIKLNYLIERLTPATENTTILSSMLPIFGLLILMAIFVFARKVMTKPISYLYPSHLFLFGKEIGKHGKRLTLRQNLLWGVVIASIISIVTGLIVWLLTKNAG